MTFGIGTDLIEISRVAGTLKRKGDNFIQRIGRSEERLGAPDRGSPTESAYWAARFAAKEAFSKAWGTGFGAELSWQDVGVASAPNGKPSLIFSERLTSELSDRKISAHLSLTHATDLALAFVVLEQT